MEYDTKNVLLDLFACRVCLATDIKLFDIHQCNLESLFEMVFGFSISPCDGFPQHLCHYCFSLLQKYALFKTKCDHSQEILKTSLMLKQEITTSYLRQIDREAEGLEYPLAVHNISFIDCEIFEETVNDNNDNFENINSSKDDSTNVIDDTESEFKNSPSSGITRRIANYPHIEEIKLTLSEQLENLQERKKSQNYTMATHTCDLCFKGFLNDNAYIAHQKLHSESYGDHVCCVCHLRFTNLRRLREHILTHERRYLCKLCQHVDISIDRAIEHQACHGKLLYKCKYCGRPFRKSSDCIHHIRVCHSGDQTLSNQVKEEISDDQSQVGESSILCQECETEFESADAFNRHLETCSQHVNVGLAMNWHCQRCGHSFSSETALDNHRVLCYRVTNNKDRMRVDFNMRPHRCMICMLGFQRKANLNRHYKVHTGIKPYNCPECGTGFTHPNSMSLHLRSVHGGLPEPSRKRQPNRTKLT